MNEILNKYVCQFENCKASFSKPFKLKIHERIHTGERPFICSFENCQKKYTSSSHLKRHVNTIHLKNQKEYKCPVCFLIFGNLTNFKRHQKRIHDGNKKQPFTCSECSQGFYKKHQLSEHMYCHTGIAPYSCSHCSLAFTARTPFKKHVRNHKEYKCDCGSLFFRWSDLLKHKRDEHKKVFVCDTCQKSFKNSPNLKKHKKTHNETQTVFVCPESDCNYEYLYKCNLRHHILAHHEKRVFECSLPNCNAKLQTKQKLQQHILKMHQENKLVKSNIKKERKKRKDSGKPKASVIVRLSNLNGIIPTHLEKEIMNDQQVDVETVIENISTSQLKNVMDEMCSSSTEDLVQA